MFLWNRGLIIGSALFIASLTARLAAERPNVVLVYMDDMGWSDMGVQGAKGFDTPNLDKLAEEGLRMAEFYSVCSVCSASRAGLLTGCYPARVMERSVLFPNSKTALHPSENTLADMFTAAGYESHMIGKWHLGHQAEVLPTEQGFKSYYGVPYSNDMGCDPRMKLSDDAVLRSDITQENFKDKAAVRYPLAPLMEGKEIIEVPSDQSTLTKRYTRRATALIEKHGSKDGEKPLFLYYAHTMPHKPIAASEDFKGTTERGLYGDVIKEIDWSIGQLISSIEKAGIGGNTLFIFSSDNGPWNDESASYLRGKKFSNWEGGQRVPTIVWWPGKIKAGEVSDRMGSTIDILPTLASIGGFDYTSRDGSPVDGVDLSAHWLGKSDDTPRKDFYYYGHTCGSKPQGVRDDRWKLITATRQSKGKGKGQQKKTDPLPWLFDLENDERETTNLASKHPDVVKRLQAKIDAFEKQIIATKREPWSEGN